MMWLSFLKVFQARSPGVERKRHSMMLILWKSMQVGLLWRSIIFSSNLLSGSLSVCLSLTCTWLCKRLKFRSGFYFSQMGMHACCGQPHIKGHCFIVFHMLLYKSLIWAGTVTHFGCPLFISWQKALVQVSLICKEFHWNTGFQT